MSTSKDARVENTAVALDAGQVPATRQKTSSILLLVAISFILVGARSLPRR